MLRADVVPRPLTGADLTVLAPLSASPVVAGEFGWWGFRATGAAEQRLAVAAVPCAVVDRRGGAVVSCRDHTPTEAGRRLTMQMTNTARGADVNLCAVTSALLGACFRRPPGAPALLS